VRGSDEKHKLERDGKWMRKEERKKAQEVEEEALLDEYKKAMEVWEKCAALRAI
jgi:hypothetical protein